MIDIENVRMFEYFQSKLVKGCGPNGDCWEYFQCRKPNGYGILSFECQSLLAHRFSWAYENKQQIPHGLMVLHACDNPPCCNPAHLSLGTAYDNRQDCKKRGRGKKIRKPWGHGTKGSAHPMSKLTENQAIFCYRALEDNTVPIKHIVKLFKVSESCIRKHAKRKRNELLEMPKVID